jgi:hypothetical protein
VLFSRPSQFLCLSPKPDNIMNVVPMQASLLNTVEQGIHAARTIFGKCYFDAEKCLDGIRVLQHFRYMELGCLLLARGLDGSRCSGGICAAGFQHTKL